MTVSEEIDQFIAENGGIERDAVNVALTRWKAAEREIEQLKRELEMERAGITEQDIYDTSPDEPKFR